MGYAYGGGKFGFGTVFKLAPTGKFTVLYSFTGGADGGLPETTPVQDASGTLYGTTYRGGASGILVTLLLVLFATQTLAPSKATP